MGDPVRSDGQWFKDAAGRTVILHGVNAVYKFPDYCPADAPTGFGDADAAVLQSLGFNVVRLGFIWKGYEATAGLPNTAYLACLHTIQRTLARHGIYTLIDSHQDVYNERFGGEGFPDWAVVDDGIPFEPMSYPDNYYEPAVTHSFDSLWLDRNHLWDAYAQAWHDVAAVFAGEPMVLGYDLMNEPFPGSQFPTCYHPAGCPGFDRALLQPFEDRLATAIRAVDATHVIFYEPHIGFSSGVPSWLTAPPAGTGPVALSFHNYCLAHNSAIEGADTATQTGCGLEDTLVQNNAASAEANLGGPGLMTEFGASDDLPEITTNTGSADAHMVGWTYWDYKASFDCPTCTTNPESMFGSDANLASLKPAKTALLARTYPMAVAGTPTGWSFDPVTGAFELTYAPDHTIRAPTVIFVPVAVHYPHGYHVTVAGGDAIGGACSAYLTIRPDPRATQVNVDLSVDQSATQAC